MVKTVACDVITITSVSALELEKFCGRPRLDARGGAVGLGS